LPIDDRRLAARLDSGFSIADGRLAERAGME